MLIESGIHGIKWKVNESGDIIGAVKGGTHLDVSKIMQDHDLHQMYHNYQKAKHETH